MTVRRTCVLATANRHKVEEIRAVLGPLGWDLATAGDRGVREEIPETGDTLEANARQKALFVAELTSSICLADDTGLEVGALGGRPGVYSARYAGKDASYADNVRLLLRELEGVPPERRAARFRTVLSLAGPGKVLLEVEGAVAGRITLETRGAGGFGYDPVFLVDELGRTLAELSMEEKNRISHRGRALAAFRERAAALAW